MSDSHNVKKKKTKDNTKQQTLLSHDVKKTKTVSPPQKNHHGSGNKPQSNKLYQIFRRYEGDLQLVLVPTILFVIFLTLFFYQTSLQDKIQAQTISPSLTVSTPAAYPVLLSPINPQISAEAAIIMDNDSHVILYTKNPTLRFSMASTTKLMTALVGLGYYQLNSVLTIQRDDVEGSKVGFHKGEQLTFESLLYGMLLPSGNDAADAIADNYPGGMSAFVAAMNAKAASLSLVNTHFGDPAGLNDDEDYTTVIDLAHLASMAIKNPIIARIVSTKEQVITTVDGTATYDLSNLNKLLGTYGVNGIKTGTTDEAGQVLITSSVMNGHTLIMIVMRSTDRFADTEQLLTLITNNIHYISPSDIETK